MRHHERRAAAGDVRRIHKLADFYYAGYGVAQDRMRAARLYKSAAHEGYRWSQLKYGAMLMDGRGVPRNPAEGRRYIEMSAASTNNSWALLRLGKIVSASDAERSRRLFERSAEKGNVEAKSILAKLRNR